ncbi:MAG TPA: pyrroloquinoline quinone biosynthesis protein PqqB [Albitalea sp.]|nr:pyrroloquinoline quinone biosynthesis protein PqqB [Albitalea sp.]
MKILVLGSGAAGGFPQWNCHCGLCAAQRAGTLLAPARTQSAMAVSADGDNWVLLNASPDIGTQLRRQPQLHPRGAGDTPIRGVVLTDAQLHHVSGLLGLREGPCIDLFATPCVFEDLTTGLPLLSVLQHYCGTRWHIVPVAGDRHSAEFEIEGAASLRFTAIAVSGEAPPYSAHRRGQVVGDSIALLIEDRRTGQRLFYAPGMQHAGDHELGWMQGADCVVVDGSATMDLLAASPARRKVLIHVQHDDPVLDDAGTQRRHLQAQGIEVAYDGMEIAL